MCTEPRRAAERIRRRKRADMAAQLHDSVIRRWPRSRSQATGGGGPAGRRTAGRAKARPEGVGTTRTTRPNRLAGGRSGSRRGGGLHGGAVEVVTVGDCELTANSAVDGVAAREVDGNRGQSTPGGTRFDVFVPRLDGDLAPEISSGPRQGLDADAVPGGPAGLRHSVMGRLETARRQRNGEVEPGDRHEDATGDGQMSERTSGAEGGCRGRQTRPVRRRGAQRFIGRLGRHSGVEAPRGTACEGKRSSRESPTMCARSAPAGGHRWHRGG